MVKALYTEDMHGVRAIGYIRVSTDEQAIAGVSLNAQKERILAYAQLYNIQIETVFMDDGYSASSLRRPGLKEALACLEDGRADAIIVAKLDRLTRSLRDLIDLTERYFKSGEAALMSVAEQLDQRTASGRLVMNILAAVAQWERETIAERTKEALRWKRENGERIGTIPYGCQLGKDGKLEKNDYEQHVIRLAKQLKVGFNMSLQDICYELENMACHPRGGAAMKWHRKQIASILKRNS